MIRTMMFRMEKKMEVQTVFCRDFLENGMSYEHYYNVW